MLEKLFFAGSGGQGILLMGQMISYASMFENKEVTFLPSYGPEMRGGTANCTVVVSDETISCPLIFEADDVIVMNPPSLTKFESMVRPGGRLFINTSLVTDKATRTDIEVIEVDANNIAAQLGNVRAANIVMLGAVVGHSGVVSNEAAEYALKKAFSGKKEKLLPLNMQAYYTFAKK